MRYGLKWPQYAAQWDAMVINHAREYEFMRLAKKFVDLKPRYLHIETLTDVPWYMIAIIHMRESNNDFSRSLAQGDPWITRSTHIPISGPFGSFDESAVWALRHDGLTSVKNLGVLEKILFYLELYNGAGYDLRGLPSPYIWGGTNIQRIGKYVSDGPRGWRSVWDKQPGCAPIIKEMMAIDSSIRPTRET